MKGSQHSPAEEDSAKDLARDMGHSDATFAINSEDQSSSFNMPGGQTLHYALGEIVGDSYRLLEQIGRGGMGVVYTAEHVIIQQKYALKLLAPEQINETSWKRFEIEGKALAKLNHKGIVKIFNMGIDKKGCPFYVMEWLRGVSLIDAESLGYEEILTIYKQVAEALGSAHSNNIVHRDVKPSNIMLTGAANNIEAKVVDFGIATLGAGSLYAQNLTAKGEILGSPLYMSPEQCSGESIDYRSDIYSLGCSLYQTLTGRPPFLGKSAMATVMMQQEVSAPPLSLPGDGEPFNAYIEELVARMLEKNPDDRYQSMQELADDLERVILGRAPQLFAVSQEFDQILPEPEKDNKRVFVFGVLGLTFAVCICLFLISHNSQNGATPASREKNDAKQVASTATAALSSTSSFTPSSISSPTSSETKSALETLSPPSASTSDAKTASILKSAFNSPDFITVSNGAQSSTKYAFPTEFSIGRIRYGENGKSADDAMGSISRPTGEPFSFDFNQSICCYPEALDKLKSAPINIVRLSSCKNNLDSILNHLLLWENLTSLTINDCPLEKSQIAVLNQFTNLGDLWFVDLQVPPSLLANLVLIDRVPMLGLKGMAIDESFAKQISQAKNLSSLSLSHCQYPSAVLATICKNPKLTNLTLKFTSLNDGDINKLSTNKSLRCLTIARCDISDKSAEQFVKMKQLNTLSLIVAQSWSESAIDRIRKGLPGRAVTIERQEF